MNSQDILREIDLGDSVAENEREKLQDYFVKTEAWNRLIKGDIDIVYGSKGAGKSALYLLLLQQNGIEQGKRKIQIVHGEEVAHDPVFKQYIEREVNLPTEDGFRQLWKVYVLALVGNHLVKNFQSLEGIQSVFRSLRENKLIPLDGLPRIFKGAKEFLERVKVSLKTPEGYEGSLTLEEPSLEEEEQNKKSVGTLLREIDDVLDQANVEIWVSFDRLDVAFTDSEIETPALRSLFRVYRDFSGLKSLKLKIFLRDDIWSRITREIGFREQSHITRTHTIRWTEDSLRHLIISRFFNNKVIEEHTAMDKGKVMGSEKAQKYVFDSIFPKQVESGPKKPLTFDWMLSHIVDGRQKPAPREIINLIKFAREDQASINEIGGLGSNPKDYLISSIAIKTALNRVSEERTNVIWSEYPDLRKYVEAFKGEKTEHSASTVVQLFKSRGLSIDRVDSVLKKLVDIGFLQEKTENRLRRTTYWVPFIFRPYLEMSQGAAFQKRLNKNS